MNSYVAGKNKRLAACTLESWLATCSVSAAMSVAKRRRFLSPSWISKLVWDSESEEDTAASSKTMSEDKGGLQDEPGVSHLQLDRPTSSGQASSSSIETSASDRIQTESDQQWTPPCGPQTGVVHTFTGGPRGIKNSEAPGIDASSSPLKSFPVVFCGNYNTAGGGD